MNPVVAASIAGGLLAIDHRGPLGLMVSQPLCGGLVIGLLLGAPMEGMLAGGLIQMMFLGHVPVRGVRKPDLPAAGVAAASLYILVKRAVGDDRALCGAILFFSLLAGFLAAVIGHLFYRWWEQRAIGLASAAAGDIEAGRYRRVSAAHLLTVLVHFAYAFCILLIVIEGGLVLLPRAAAGLVGAAGGALGSLALLVPFIAVGSLMRLHFIRTRVFWFGTGFLVTYLFIVTWG